MSAILDAYLDLLKRRPVLTKSVTSAVLSSMGQLIAQHIRGVKKLETRSIAAFGIFGLCFNGPITHKFYEVLEKVAKPSNTKGSFAKLLMERMIFAPLFTLLFFVVVSLLEGKTWAETKQKVAHSYPGAVKMNLLFWTPAQYFNLNYVSLQYRVLFANAVAFLWSIYLAKRMSAPSTGAGAVSPSHK